MVFSGLTVPEAAAIAEISYELERRLTIAARIWRRGQGTGRLGATGSSTTDFRFPKDSLRTLAGGSILSMSGILSN
jgi:hypothetical protein